MSRRRWLSCYGINGRFWGGHKWPVLSGHRGADPHWGLKVDAVISGPSFGAGNEDQRSHHTGHQRKDQLDSGRRDSGDVGPAVASVAEKLGLVRYGGLFDRRTRRPSPKRVPMADVERVLRLYREKYFDLNVKHFVEKLHHEEQISLSYTWVKAALQNAGLVQRYAKRGPHRRKRPRRPLTGMMLHVDGSRHRWIPGLDQYQDLIVIFDDATSEVYDVQLVDEESTVTVMAALKRVVETRGLFCSLYSDRGSHMAWTPKAGGPVDRQKPTQIARALDQLGIELILAYSPQAR